MTGERPAWRVVLAGGGTGGHLYPGIAVAREILERAPSSRVVFAGTARGLEARVLPREGFPLALIRSGGLKGKSRAAMLRGFATLPLSGFDGWRLLSREKPQIVIGLGGYSSGPVVLMAAVRGIPTMLLEQNAVPGLTNRLLARVVRAAAVTYDVTLPYFGWKGFVSGNPVRPSFFEAGRTRWPGGGPPGRATRVLIFGGSQGAHAINVAMIEGASALAEAGLSITHQTGERDVELVRTAYRAAGLEARVEPFLFEIDREMADADVVVSRAGATTLAEIAAAARPAILIPLPTATDDHQRRNAEVFERGGAAERLDQRELTGPRLAARIVSLANDPARREKMATAVRKFSRPDAAAAIVDRALALAKSARGSGGD